MRAIKNAAIDYRRGFSSKVMEITPAMAVDMLKKNNKNRPISNTYVKKFAKDMREGKWMVNGEAIVFSQDGTLLDGQHRLQAIVESGSAVTMCVVNGISEDAYKTIDIGRKRTAADAIATFDEKFLKDRGVIAAAISTLYQFEGGIYNEDARSKHLSHEDVISFAEKNFKHLSRSLEHVRPLGWARKIVPFSCLVAIHYLFNKVDPFETETFFHKLNSGEGMHKDDPVNLLRNRLMEIRSAGGVFRTREVIPYLLKTWELIREGKTVTRLRIDSDYIPRVV